MIHLGTTQEGWLVTDKQDTDFCTTLIFQWIATCGTCSLHHLTKMMCSKSHSRNDKNRYNKKSINNFVHKLNKLLPLVFIIKNKTQIFALIKHLWLLLIFFYLDLQCYISFSFYIQRRIYLTTVLYRLQQKLLRVITYTYAFVGKIEVYIAIYC